MQTDKPPRGWTQSPPRDKMISDVQALSPIDRVKWLYARASDAFDAKVLREFIVKYPEHAQPLQRYAQVQLTFKRPSQEEVEAESITDEEMLPQQSKLLQRMQQLRGTPSLDDVAEASGKLAAVTGEGGVAAAKAVTGSLDHDEGS